MSKSSQRIFPIRGVIKNYPWGSRTTLAVHRGEGESSEPEAELWFGDNPHGAAQILGSDKTLDHITNSTTPLPFLAKILAVENSLSLQVHPAIEDIPLLSASRKDENHKPEMIIALTEFDAFVGFSSRESIESLLAIIDSPKLDMLIARPIRAGASITSILDGILGVADSSGILDEVCRGLGKLEPLRAHWLSRLIDLYAPKLDPLATLLCELVRLTPGESIYLPPRCVHAYLHGTVVEVMANSDNVIRGGLTHKPIDKQNFLTLIERARDQAERLTPSIAPGIRRWRAPINDFSITEYHGEIDSALEIMERSIAFAWNGSAEISTSALTTVDDAIERVAIQHSDGAFLTPGRYHVLGNGSLWVATGKGR